MTPAVFREQIKLKKFSQSYIFEGNFDFLNDIKNEFIQAVLNPNLDLKISKEILENTNPDLMIIRPQKNTISINSIREMIDYLQIRPLSAAYKLVIIEDGDLLGNEASNALLKTLEESFNYVIICILVSSRYKLLETIRSRCIFVCEDHFRSKFLYEDYEKLFELISMALKGDFSSIYDSKNKEYLLSFKDDDDFFQIIFEFFKSFYLFLEIKDENTPKFLLRFFNRNIDVKKEKIEKILIEIERIKNNLYNNVNFQLSIEKLFIEILS